VLISGMGTCSLLPGITYVTLQYSEDQKAEWYSRWQVHPCHDDRREVLLSTMVPWRK